ncbi:unnamed protein product [Cylindrotheca closterium]|uniref:Glycosyltransferase 2-like domain-containing protein n=1 Tax=Cylindrotheca closterium TaxID=2856 RepID=A0AAD2FY52_9STRA|nr:unnamed protein product [Cylindrotheca closterium]
MFNSSTSSKLVATKGNTSRARRDRRTTRIITILSVSAGTVAIILLLCWRLGVVSTRSSSKSNGTIRGNSASRASYDDYFQPQECAVGLWNQDTHTLEVNPNCPASQKLLNMKPPPTDKTLTFFLIYFNDHHHLAHQLKSWISYGQNVLDQIQFVIVDDSSAPGHTAAEFLQANINHNDSQTIRTPLDIVIYKIDQNLMWNIGGARNLGFWMANTPWVFMSDTDTQVAPETMKYILEKVSSSAAITDTSSPAVYTFFQRQRDSGFKPHPAVMLIRKQDYWKVGGCDEDFVGSYGWTDPHFRYKVQEDPTLHAIKAHTEMDELGITPLREMNDDIECPNGIVCLEKFHGEKAPKEPEKNEAKFKRKSQEGKWSNEVLRYTWKRVKWQQNSWWDFLLWWS